MKSASDDRIPVIDLFAGPGGLGEGFHQFAPKSGSRFRIALSIEMEEKAVKTLTLRSFFRQFQKKKIPGAYYKYLRGEIDRDELFNHDDECRRAAKIAKNEVQMIELGDKPDEDPDEEKRARVKELIREQIKGHKQWVLIGGPPCQAYSLAGRSRMLGSKQKKGETKAEHRARLERIRTSFEKDHRHHLYREYLKIIADHWPPVFVMENVKGILSAKDEGELIFPKIKQELSNPIVALKRKGKQRKYALHSLTVATDPGESPAEDRSFLIKAEEYGVPQNRHRVILLGIRTDVLPSVVPALRRSKEFVLRDLFTGLPPALSGVTDRDSLECVLDAVSKSPWFKEIGGANRERSSKENRMIQKRIRSAEKDLRKHILSIGGSSGHVDQKRAKRRKKPMFTRIEGMEKVPGKLGKWLEDNRLKGVCNHVTKDHKESDLHRYLFCASFREAMQHSPKLVDFPRRLLPDHDNVQGADADLKKHADRFRALPYDKSSPTITSHLGKDGHAFIHPDPGQMRALTPREAARIQTFPDNYFFEGGYAGQYQQIGNAVPPYLAHQIAGVVSKILDQTRDS